MTHFRRYGYAVLAGLAMLLALAPTGIAAAGTPAGDVAAVAGDSARPVTTGRAAVLIPPGDNLVVFAYFDGPDKRTLVGQRWHGCNQPAGAWGTTSPYSSLFFTPC
jgi:hypothetical protein